MLSLRNPVLSRPRQETSYKTSRQTRDFPQHWLSKDLIDIAQSQVLNESGKLSCNNLEAHSQGLLW